MATDIEKLFAEITNGLDLLKSKQVEIVADQAVLVEVPAAVEEVVKKPFVFEFYDALQARSRLVAVRKNEVFMRGQILAVDFK